MTATSGEKIRTEKAEIYFLSEDVGVKGGKSKPYEQRTKKELYEQAVDLDIKGRSYMNKANLIKALRSN